MQVDRTIPGRIKVVRVLALSLCALAVAQEGVVKVRHPDEGVFSHSRQIVIQLKCALLYHQKAIAAIVLTLLIHFVQTTS